MPKQGGGEDGEKAKTKREGGNLKEERRNEGES